MGHRIYSLAFMAHIVWDWNGTLFDDLHVVVEAVSMGVARFGIPPISLDDYRDHFTRPVKHFYDRLLGREVTEAEWRELDRLFHDGYREMLDRASLNRDARAALELARRTRHTQSLLSMFPHDELIPLVDTIGISGYFDRIDGLRGVPGDTKAAYLEAHMSVLIAGEDPANVLVIGDTPDDAVAAAHVGARCVLYNGGSHHREELELLGVPVVDSLVEALEAS